MSRPRLFFTAAPSWSRLGITESEPRASASGARDTTLVPSHAGYRIRAARARFGRVAKRPAARAAAICFLALLAALPAAAQQSPRARQMGNRIMCMCGGCEDTAGSCNHTGGAFSGPCPTALGELKELDQRVGKGESDDLVLQDFVQEYGPQVLVVPPARGFDLAAWIMPVAVTLVGFLLALVVVRRWRGRALNAAPAGPGLPVRPELIARARAETDNEDF